MADPAAGVAKPAASSAIAVDRLTKRYGGRVAVSDVSFAVAPGEIFALLGPNGAGKTTTIEILEGYRNRNGGEVRVLGLDPGRDAARLRRRIGLMLQEGGVYQQVRPREILAHFARFYPDPDDPDRLIDLVGLRESLGTTYRRLSGGQKQRLSLALALIGRPELVFLDEPTAGLDPRARRATWDVIADLKSAGVTVLLTTHFLDEAEYLADRIGILDRGRLVALGDLESLRGGGDAIVRLTADPPPDPADLASLAAVRSAWTDVGGVCLMETEDPPALLAEVTAWALDRGVRIREIRVGNESLEEIYLRLTVGDTAG